MDLTEERHMKITAAVVPVRSAPFEIETLDLAAPLADEVLVRVVASGMCHTDLHARDGYFPNLPYPVVCGHEGAGTTDPAVSRPAGPEFFSLRVMCDPEKSLPDNGSGPDWGDASGTAVYRGSVVCLGHNPVVWGGPALMVAAGGNMAQSRAILASIGWLVAVAFAAPCDARVVRLVVEQTRSFAGGMSFGDVGPYQRLDGTAYMEVDPRDPLNAIYPAKNPIVMGLGYAVTRDIGSFLRYDTQDDLGNSNPLAANPTDVGIRRSYSFGSSSTGMYQREFLYLGFNEDESHCAVFDARWIHKSGKLNALP
jgi:Alcohol dehydrogenase GroES-like domain